MLTESEKNFVRDSFKTFLRNSYVHDIVFTDKFPDKEYSAFNHAIKSRRRIAWFNEKSGCINIYTPNIEHCNIPFIQSHVLSVAVEHFGFANLFRPEFGRLLASGMGNIIGERFDDITHVSNYLHNLVSKYNLSEHQELFGKSVNLVVSLNGFIFNAGFDVSAMRFGLGRYQYNKAVLNAKSGDYSFFDERCTKEFNNRIRIDEPFELYIGYAGDLLKNLGYLDREVYIHSSGIVRTCKKHFDGDLSVFKNLQFASLFHNPLFIYRCNNAFCSSDYAVVTDFSIMDKRLCFYIGGPDYINSAVRYKEDKNMRPFRIGATPSFVSESKLCRVLANTVDDWRYMREIQSESGHDKCFEYLDMLGLTETIKSGALPSPASIAGCLDTELLMRIAKIAKDFENPKDSVEISEAAGEKVDPQAVMIEKSCSVSESVFEEDRQEAVVPRRNYKFPSGLFSKTTAAKLGDAGIICTNDVFRVGLGDFRKAAGNDRALNKVVQWMADKGLYILPSVKPVVNESVTRDEVISHLSDNLLALSGTIKGTPVVARRLDGSYFAGSDALHLCICGLNQKSQSCPYWVTRNELSSFGCVPGKAEPVPVWNGGECTYVYNLSKTDFPKVNQDAYRLLMDRRTVGPDLDSTGRYIANLVNSIRPSCVMGNSYTFDSFFNHMDGFTSSNMVELKNRKDSSLTDIVGEDMVSDMERKGKAKQFMDYAETFKDGGIKKSK